MPETPAPHRVPVSAGDSPDLAALFAAARSDELAMVRLEELCDDIGPRLGGSEGLARAVTWARETFASDGLSNVRAEEVAVPHWERGAESLLVTAPFERPIGVLALGGSVGTVGIEAPVSVVTSFDELGPQVAGTIVLYDVPMEETFPAVRGYGDTIRFRGQGASRAAEHGAVAALVRSRTTRSLYTLHTGAMRYDEGVPAIPSAAITVEDAAMIHRLVERGETVRLRLALGARTLPDAPSHNVLAEIPGSVWPDEVVLVSAHLDSWDVGQGAHDDGAGVVHVIETMRLLAALGLEPRRTIRAVLFTNEENGLRGGRAYGEAWGPLPASDRNARGERHVAAVESDLGAFWPQWWSAAGDDAQLAWLRAVAAPLGLEVRDGHGGADISPLKDRGVLSLGLMVDDTRYFDVHHTHADTVDKVDPTELREGLAAVAGLTWLLANADRE